MRVMLDGAERRDLLLCALMLIVFYYPRRRLLRLHTYSSPSCLLFILSTMLTIAGKPWTYRLEIKRATNLPVFCEMAYVSYDFFGEAFTTGAC